MAVQAGHANEARCGLGVGDTMPSDDRSSQAGGPAERTSDLATKRTSRWKRTAAFILLWSERVALSIQEWSKRLVALITWLGALALIVLMTAVAFQRHNVDIDTIGVPKSLAEGGYTGEVAAIRLRDALNKVLSRATTTVPGLAVAETAKPRNINIPGTGASFDTLVSFIRSFVPARWRHDVGGEFTEADSKIQLTVRYNGLIAFESEYINPEMTQMLIEEAAAPLLEAMYREKIIETPANPNSYMGFGYLLAYEKRLDEAANRFREAIKLDFDRRSGAPRARLRPGRAEEEG